MAAAVGGVSAGVCPFLPHCNWLQQQYRHARCPLAALSSISVGSPGCKIVGRWKLVGLHANPKADRHPTPPPSYRALPSGAMSALLQTAMQRLTSVSRLAGRQLVAQAPASRRVFTTKAVKASVGKRDLIEDVAKRTGLPAKEADKVVNAILDSIVDSVAAGKRCKRGPLA